MAENKSVFVRVTRGDEVDDIPVAVPAGATDADMIDKIGALFSEYAGGSIRWETTTCGRAVAPAADKG